MAESMSFLTEAFAAGGGGGPSAAPAFGTAGTHRASSTASPAFAVPASVANNDVIVIPIFVDSPTVTISAMAPGFDWVPGFPYAAIGAMNHRVLFVWKRATGADTGTYSFTLSAGPYNAGAALRYTGCQTTGTPFDTASGGDTPNAQSSTNVNVTPAVNVTSLGAFRMFLHIGTLWSGGTWTPPTGYTKRMDGNDHVHILSDKVQNTAANSGSVTANCTGTDKSNGYIVSLIGA